MKSQNDINNEIFNTIYALIEIELELLRCSIKQKFIDKSRANIKFLYRALKRNNNGKLPISNPRFKSINERVEKWEKNNESK